jgi:hypothetical protein
MKARKSNASEQKMTKNRNRGHWNRSRARINAGSLMAEAAAGLVMLAMLFAGGVIFLSNVALLSYYRDKIGSVTNHASAYGASLSSWCNSYDPNLTDDMLSHRTRTLARQALSEMHLPAGSNVTVTAKTVDKKIAVTVTVSNLRLIGEGNIFPLTVTLSDTALAPLNNDEPPMLVRIGGRIPVVVPSYGKWDRKLSYTTNDVPADIARLSRLRTARVLMGNLAPLPGSVRFGSL